MLTRLYMSSYNHKCNQRWTWRAAREQEDEKNESEQFINVLQDVEKLLDEPILSTNQFGTKLIQKLVSEMLLMHNADDNDNLKDK